MEPFSALLALCEGEFTGHRWIPLTKAGDVELWCFLWSTAEQTVEQKQSRRWWLETDRAHYDVIVMRDKWLVGRQFDNEKTGSDYNKQITCA